MTNPALDSRARFEAHFSGEQFDFDMERCEETGVYFSEDTRLAWEAWQAAIASQWIAVADRMPPACHTIIAHGKKYGKKWPTPQVYETYTGTRPRETVEDEEITHWQFRPDAPTPQDPPIAALAAKVTK